MARNVSLLELRTWARQISDTENDPEITDTELTALANRHLTEVYDRLVDAGPPEYYASVTQVTTKSGIIQYPLEADFRNLLNVYVRESTDERRQLHPLPAMARNRVKAPTEVWTLDVEYVATPTPLEADGDTFDGVSGWEELIVNLMARSVLKKQQRSTADVIGDIQRLEQRMVSRARQRDRGQPKRTTDMDDAMVTPFPWGWTGQTRLVAYRLFGGNLELYETLWGLP